MSVWRVKPFKTRSLKGYKIPIFESLVQGDKYYTKDHYTSKMNNEWIFDPEYQKSLGLLSYYERDLKSQISSGLIWIKE